MFEWFELRNFLEVPNYFWLLCASFLLLVGACTVLGILLGRKASKIKTLNAILHEETSCNKNEECQCESCNTVDEKHDDTAATTELADENMSISSELHAFKGMYEKACSERDDLSEEVENLKNEIAKLKEVINLKDEDYNKLRDDFKENTNALDALKAKNIEYSADIASYKTTNEILSKSNDELKSQLVESGDVIRNLQRQVSDLQLVKKKVEEEENNNKVLMKAVSLIIDVKENNNTADNKKIILHEERETLKKSRTPVGKVSDENLETLKRPELMHLAKREGVKHFARKSNKEIIKLIKENRRTK